MPEPMHSAGVPLPNGAPEARLTPARPARVTAAIVVLIVVAGLALLFAARNVMGYVESAGYQGVATRMSFVEFVVDAPEQTLIPLGVTLASGAAAFGMVRRREWGRRLALGMAVVIGLGGLLLILAAVREWNLPGSFAVLLVPPGVGLLLVGGYLAYAAVSASAYFRSPGPL